MKTTDSKLCSSCNSSFTCGMATGNCWCYHFPPIFQPEPNATCICPDCLKTAIIARINDYVSTITPATALTNMAKNLPKVANQIDIDYYIEGGLTVFTAWFHLKRGYCCKSNCRHCPYGYKKGVQNE